MAYALQPLIRILEQQLVLDINPQVEPLLAKAKFLKERVSLYKDLESRIRDAAYEAEDVIESYIVDSDSLLDLTEVMEVFDFIKEELMNIDPATALNWRSEREPPYNLGVRDDIVVGFDQETIHLLELLLLNGGTRSSLQIIPIVGIGGGGKTTLAKRLYNDALILDHFDVLGWTTISQNYNLKQNLLDLLNSFKKFTNVRRDDELDVHVYANLCGRRYLVVVDDIWDMDAWDQIRRLFPDNKNGSRVILTTRKLIVADYARLSSEPHQMRLLNDEESWELLAQKVFGHIHNCPPELVETGISISRCAHGLPLALITIAGHLSTLEKTLEVWKAFEERQIGSIQQVDSNNNEISETRNDPVIEGIVNLFLKDGHQLIELITGRKQELKIIPIVGMGGSGKTTLAQLLYNRLSYAGRFDIHAWITSSGHKKTKDALREILHSLREGMGTKEMPRLSDNDEVGEHIHKILYQRRYLVVLYNIKDVNNWDVLRRFFPDNKNGSRIILTAGEWNVADYDRTPFRMNSYWEFLLQKEAFEHEDKIRLFWKIYETNQRSGDITIRFNINELRPFTMSSETMFSVHGSIPRRL